MKTKHSANDDKPRGESILGLGGIFSGLSDLVEKLNTLSETGAELRQTGEIHGAGKGVKGIYGFTVKVGLGDKSPHVEPFGNIRKDKNTGEAVVQEIREPAVDLFEEQDHLLIVAEMPGISAKDVQIDVKDDVLTISAAHGEKKYRKEVLLPGTYAKEKMRLSCNNGVLEIKCFK
jgi:HSP20 family protein